VMDRLGRPQTADKYELDVPQGVTPDAAFQTWAKGVFHKVGLTAAQAKEVSKAWNDNLASMATKTENDYKARVASEKQELLGEWKGGHERMMNLASSAAKAIGFSGEMIDAMEQAVQVAGRRKYGHEHNIRAEIDKKTGKYRLSRKVLLPKPEKKDKAV